MVTVRIAGVLSEDAEKGAVVALDGRDQPGRSLFALAALQNDKAFGFHAFRQSEIQDAADRDCGNQLRCVVYGRLWAGNPLAFTVADWFTLNQPLPHA